MNPFASHPHWNAISVIHGILKNAGFSSLIAGGAVRDLLLGREPKDIDLATDAKPDEVEKLFAKTIMVGKAFGVSRVVVQGVDIEVATFRKDGPYLDGRKPQSIEFCDIEEDAKRRDFTINAMFYDLDLSQVIDHVGGQKDLMKKTIRTVGDPLTRFNEDKLRVLRALRFHSQLGFSIENATAQAIQSCAANIHQVSMERIRDEWQKLMLGEFAISAFQRTYDLALWGPLFKGWKFQADEYKKIFKYGELSHDQAWALWFLVHCQESKEAIAELGLHWKLPKKQIQKIIYCFLSLSQLRNISQVEPVDLAMFLDNSNGEMATSIYENLYQGRLKQNYFDKIKAARAFFEGRPRLPECLVTGDDLIQYGIAPGPQIAKELKRLYRIQLKEKLQNKEELLKK